MSDLLNQELADLLDLSLQAKQAHWNVKGPHFIGLHQLFDQVAGQLAENADDVAERAAALGGTAEGALQIIAQRSRLAPYPVNLTSGRGHVIALTSAMNQFGATTRAAIDRAAEAGDADTADLLTEISRGIDKLRWMVGAHLEAND